ncbi:MAG: PilZ domain-containing protein, partial [Candidatus Omnitrophota bacterium]|nr:PilZ domain-containing protein [Candidatus Omnitrophota bacterium]
MALVTSQDIELLAQLYIKFDLIDLRLEGEERRRHIEMTGEVVSNIVTADGSHRLGIRFDNLSDHDKITLNRFVKRNSLPGS